MFKYQVVNLQATGVRKQLNEDILYHTGDGNEFITGANLIRLRVKLRRTRKIGIIARCLHRSLSPELALGFIPFD